VRQTNWKRLLPYIPFVTLVAPVTVAVLGTIVLSIFVDARVLFAFVPVVTVVAAVWAVQRYLRRHMSEQLCEVNRGVDQLIREVEALCSEMQSSVRVRRMPARLVPRPLPTNSIKCGGNLVSDRQLGRSGRMRPCESPSSTVMVPS
jgi:hypothetical protein